LRPVFARATARIFRSDGVTRQRVGAAGADVIRHDTDVTGIQLRAARTAEVDLLGDLALRSKGHWGYDRSFLNACRTELTFEPDELGDRRIVVAESAGRVLGFYSLDGEPPSGELGNMWVEPDSIGIGVGRRLWQHAIQTAREAGFTKLRIGAEPVRRRLSTWRWEPSVSAKHHQARYLAGSCRCWRCG